MTHPRPHPTTWRDRQPAIYAGLFVGVLIAAGIAWRMGTLQYFVGGFS